MYMSSLQMYQVVISLGVKSTTLYTINTLSRFKMIHHLRQKASRKIPRTSSPSSTSDHVDHILHSDELHSSQLYLYMRGLNTPLSYQAEKNMFCVHDQTQPSAQRAKPSHLTRRICRFRRNSFPLLCEIKYCGIHA